MSTSPHTTALRRWIALARVEARDLAERGGVRAARALGWSLLLGHGVALGVIAALPGGRGLVDAVAARAFGTAAALLGGLAALSVAGAFSEGRGVAAASLAATRGLTAREGGLARWLAGGAVVGLATLRPVVPLLLASLLLAPTWEAAGVRVGAVAAACGLTAGVGALGAALALAAASAAPSRPRAAFALLVAAGELAAATWPGTPGPVTLLSLATGWLAQLGAGT